MGTRSFVLVRHGQYAPEDGGKLTQPGREQAEHTGVWLKSHLEGAAVDVLWTSTLVRARETAEIIARSCGKTKVKPTGLLREGMYTKLKGFDVPAEERLADRARADSAWTRLFRTSRTDRLELVVCHGNLIRYLVCRALRVSVGRWTRMNSNHCGITRILIRDTGAIRVVTYNETAHLPRHLVT
jgi:serine/threonine-protein phosphatase PGAM5